MDKLFEHTAALSRYLRTCVRISHKEVIQPFLAKLLGMVKIFKDECYSQEEKLLQDLLVNLISVESKMSGAEGAKFLDSLVSVIEHLFARLFEQVDTIRKLEGEKQDLLARIADLGNLVDLMDCSVAEPDACVVDSLVNHQNYLHHYTARHSHSESQVMVVLWKSKLPGPFHATEDLPILYVYHKEPMDDVDAMWGRSTAVREKRQVAGAVSNVEAVHAAIEKYQQKLFVEHSNLVAIRAAEAACGSFYAEFVVVCKHFIPCSDVLPLPRGLGDVPTRVCAGIVRLCGPRELRHLRPVRPGVGFAAGVDAVLKLDDADHFVQPSVGTIGGFYVSNGIVYGVTCAHCLQLKPDAFPLHPQHTPALQPSAMGLILEAVSRQRDLIRPYERLKQNDAHNAMTYLVKELNERTNGAFSADLSTEAQFGTVRGGVLGALDGDGAVVDVGLVELGTTVEWSAHCNPSLQIPHSPPLVLGDGATTPIMPLAAMAGGPSFLVYGKGAVSDDTMEATINPQDTLVYIRTVKPGSLGLVHRCYHAATSARDWQPGDSGTWCWTASGMLVGMGIAYASIDGVYYCCILPMHDVQAAIAQVL